jgi:hypothetical protein
MKIGKYEVSPSNTYKKPTPRSLVIFGDGLVTISDLIVVTGLATGKPWLSTIALITGRAGKWFLKWFSDDSKYE